VQTQASLAPDVHYALMAGTDSMLYWLARAAKLLRETAGRRQVHVAAEIPVDQSKVYRFEQYGDRPVERTSWPRHVDEMIHGYAGDLEIEDRAIWALAYRMWSENTDLPELADQIIQSRSQTDLAGALATPLEELAQAASPPPRESARTRRAPRRRAAS
jgi:hypothetical protein